MTIESAIERINDLKPNSYNNSVKIMWLSEIELLIRDEILMTHEHFPEEMREFKGYGDDTPMDTELYVKAPYDNLYVYYVMMMIDKMNNDAVHYQSSASSFSAAYSSFSQWYNRTFRPLKRGQYMKFIRR